jgi:hypothetical protein
LCCSPLVSDGPMVRMEQNPKYHMAIYAGTKSCAIVWLLEIPLPRISHQSFWPRARDEVIPQTKHLACNYSTASICQGAQGRAKSGFNWIRKECRPLKEQNKKNVGNNDYIIFMCF